MKVTRIKFKNVLGFDEFEFEPGKGFTEITGRNGHGKSSIISGIQAIGIKGHDATLLREGSKEGEIVLELDDGMMLRKRIQPEKTDVEVRVGRKVQPRPAEIVQSLIDQLSNNPVELLKAKPADRIKILLETMPLDVDYGQLTEIAGFQVKQIPGVHGLYAIDTTRGQIFEARTGTNRAVDEKKKTIKQLRELLPEESGAALGGEDDIEAQIAALEEERDAELSRIDTKLSSLKAANDKEVADIKAAADLDIEVYQGQITGLQNRIAEIQACIAARREHRAADAEAKTAEFREIAELAGQQRQITLEDHAAVKEPLQAQLTAIRSNRDESARRVQALKTIEQMEAELSVLEEEAAAQTQALKEIDAYKLDLLKSLPIPGLELRDKQLYRDGVAFDRLNTAQKTDIAIEIAKLRAGRLGLICVDGLELMDDENYEAFRERALQEKNLQFVVSRVANHDLEVNTI